MALNSKIIISLDFELHWGVFDHVSLNDQSRRYFLRTRELIPELLRRFLASGIRSTWATVGFLFAEDKNQLREFSPRVKPAYVDEKLNPYKLLENGTVGDGEKDDPFHFGYSLIEKILETPGQEMASHTFSHYYCLEAGQDSAAFQADLQAAQRIAGENFSTRLNSLVFPRNQYPPEYLSVLREEGFSVIRSNPSVWFWQAEAAVREKLHKKAARLLDHYLPLSPDTSFSWSPGGSPHNLPASRFFRPYIAKIDAYGGQILKIRRIKREMTQAAISGKHYHLWWHPHNLATHPQKNMEALDEIILHFQKLRDTYGMESWNMGDFSRQPATNEDTKTQRSL